MCGKKEADKEESLSPRLKKKTRRKIKILEEKAVTESSRIIPRFRKETPGF
jgi:hypothetical protein